MFGILDSLFGRKDIKRELYMMQMSDAEEQEYHDKCCVIERPLVWPAAQPKDALSYDVVVFDRAKMKKPCALIMGVSGVRKTVLATHEVLNTLKSDSESQIIVIDTYAMKNKQGRWESRYAPILREHNGNIIYEGGDIIAAGGTLVDMSPDSGTRINPIPEINSNYPAEMVEALVCGWYANIPNHGHEVTAAERAIISRCIKNLYDSKPRFTPGELFRLIGEQPEPEAGEISKELSSLFQYFPIFDGSEHVPDHTGRILIYSMPSDDYQPIPSFRYYNYETIFLLCCLSDAWSRAVANSRKGIKTWIYVDDGDNFIENAGSFEFYDMVSSKAVSCGCFPTMIIHGLYDSPLKEYILRQYKDNGLFIIMQTSHFGLDSNELADLFGLSTKLRNYLWESHNWDPGRGAAFIDGKFAAFSFSERFIVPSETIHRRVREYICQSMTHD